MTSTQDVGTLHSLDAEAAVLGGLLLRPALVGSLKLEVLDFFSPKNQAVFGAMRNLDAAGSAVDTLTVAEELRRTGKAAAVGRGMEDGALAYVMDLSLRVPSAENVARYALVLGRYRRRRAAAQALSTSLEMVRREDIDSDDVLLEAIGELRRLDEVEDPAEVDPFVLEVRQALAEVKAALGTAAASQRVPMFFPATDLFGCEFPPTPWLITGLMTRGGVSQCSAEPKCGKTWVSLEEAVAVATGTKAFGEFYAEHGRVAYFFAEDDGRQVRNRIRALMVGRGLPPVAPDNLFVCPRGKFLDITKDEDLAWIIASARRLGKLDLLVLDPMRDISSAAEDKSDEMRNVMRNLRLLGERLGCTVRFVHHSIKAGDSTKSRSPGQRSRGSSAIHGATDSGLYLTALEGGDGVEHFELGATSEIKGARSAGYFGLTLRVVDENSEAVRATWTVDRDKAKGKAKAKGPTKPTPEQDDAKVLAFVRELAMRGEVLTRRALRDHDQCPIPEKRARESLDRLTEDAGPMTLGPAGKVIPRGRL